MTKRIVLDIEELREYNRSWKQEKRKNTDFRGKEIERNKEWRDRNKEKISKQKKEYYEKNKEAILEAKKQRHKERWKRNVKWDTELTGFVYSEARHLRKLRKEATGFVWSVDHVIPLVGKEVSGLHVWNNIQVIPLQANQRKHNKYEEDCSRLRNQHQAR